MSLGVPYNAWNFFFTKELLASQEGLCFVELVGWLVCWLVGWLVG
jgi:hypothetical protein